MTLKFYQKEKQNAKLCAANRVNWEIRVYLLKSSNKDFNGDPDKD